jgi:hypothetical protein
MKKKNFDEVISSIQLHLKTGDLTEISKRCGLHTKTWHEAKKRSSWEELTGGETKIVLAAISFLKERDELIQYAEIL